MPYILFYKRDSKGSDLFCLLKSRCCRTRGESNCYCAKKYKVLHTGVTLKTACAYEGLWIRICATEAAVEVHRLVAATLLEDVLAE